MAVAKLTKSLVAKLPPDAAIWDTEVRGFGVRRQTDGTYFYLRYTIGGRQRMRSIGRFGSPWTVEQARRHALQALGSVVGGNDPFAANAAGDTFSALVEVYLARKQSAFVGRTHHDVSRYLRSCFRPFASRQLAEISRRDIAACLATIEAASGPASRNRARTCLSAFFTFAIAEGHAEANPVQGTGKAPGASRDRCLSDAELAAVWRSLPTGIYGDIVRLLLMTGQRRQEIGGLRWSEVNFADRMITLPAERCKNGRSHTIPLSEPALAILTARHSTARHSVARHSVSLSRDPSHSPNGNGSPNGNAELVFGNGRNGFNAWGDGKLALDRRLPAMPPFVIHDIRRSVASGMARIGVNLPVIEKILNHVSGSFAGIVGVYQRHDFADEKRAALEKWATHLSTIVGLAKATTAA
jgi:integrase